MTVHDAIREAAALLPGEPAPKGQTDPRWQAILTVEEYLQAEPQAVWEFIRTWGGHEQEDLRDAVATCLLEHLLQDHFDAFFPRVEELALAEPRFGDMFLRCWKLGQSEQPDNASRFDALRQRLSGRLLP